MRWAAYDRAAAVKYAEKWALGRNPAYGDFSGMGGDCANFISQCLFAGSGVMNEQADVGWYYRGMNRRSPAWSGAVFLHRYLVRKGGVGPVGEERETEALLPGDVVFLRSGGRIYHSLLVVKNEGAPLIAAHTVDSWLRPLNGYALAGAVGVHITGVWKEGGDA